MPPGKPRGGDQSRGPLTDTERALILDLAASGLGRNEIAAEVGRSAGTVTKVCKTAGLGFNREATRSATEARSADLAGMRTLLEEASWREYGNVLSRLQARQVTLVQFAPSLGEWSEHTVPTIPAKDLADIAKAAKDLASAAKLLADANRENLRDDSMDGLDAWLSAEVDAPVQTTESDTTADTTGGSDSSAGGAG